MADIDINDLCFIDSETRRVPNAPIGDVTEVGAYRHAEYAFPTMWTFAIGEDPVEIMALDDGFDERLTWDFDAPDHLKEFHERVLHGEAWYVAWNMAFDRLIWNGPESDFPLLRPENTLDAMAQAAASGLPTKLKHAAKWVGLTQKIEEGDHLIKIFEPPNGQTPQDRPEDWEGFKIYGCDDVAAMRDVFMSTRQMDDHERRVYWASERINDRGMGLDTRLCAAASVLVDDNKAIMSRRMDEITNGAVTAVTQVQRIVKWADPILRMRPEARRYFIEKKEILNADGEVTRPEKLSLARERIEGALLYYEALEDRLEVEDRLVEALVLRRFGGSNTPGKFMKALMMQLTGRLRGQYVFNGAPQTGRFSSRGVQVHNLTRDHLGELEETALQMISEIEDERVNKRLKAAGV